VTERERSEAVEDVVAVAQVLEEAWTRYSKVFASVPADASNFAEWSRERSAHGAAIEALRAALRALESTPPQPTEEQHCDACGDTGYEHCESCNDGGVNRGGGDCMDCAPPKPCPKCSAPPQPTERSEVYKRISDYIARRRLALYDSDNKVSRAIKDELGDILLLLTAPPQPPTCGKPSVSQGRPCNRSPGHPGVCCVLDWEPPPQPTERSET